MSDKYIKREDALKILSRYDLHAGSVLGHHSGAVDLAMEEIECLPAAPVREVVRGRWIAEQDFLLDVVNRCSACGDEFVLIDGTPAENNYHFCPNCGADMREEEVAE